MNKEMNVRGKKNIKNFEKMVTRQTTRLKNQQDCPITVNSKRGGKDAELTRVTKPKKNQRIVTAKNHKNATSSSAKKTKGKKLSSKKAWSIKPQNLKLSDTKKKRSTVVKPKVQIKTTSKKSKAATDDSNKENVAKVVKLTRVALKKHEMRNDDLVTIRPPNRGDSWDGNSDADGSVNSGVLEENICSQCGCPTLDEESLETVICDICGGEYHFRCVGLEILPRLSYKCQDCLDEIEWNAKKNFDLHNALQFPLPPKRRKNQTAEVCYSPSRPLELAWEECVSKGFMLVKNVFPKDVIDKLTHGGIRKVTKYGRIAESWNGAVHALSSQINRTTHNVINRDGRFDIKIPKFVIDELQLEKLLDPILLKLKTIMSPHRTPQLRTHNIILAPIGSDSQSWHYDDSMKQGKHHYYFTILIHLNSIDDLCGGTEIWCKKLKRGDLIRGRPGDAFVFNGSLLHRGQGNKGFTHRWFYYASFSCAQDANEVRI